MFFETIYRWFIKLFGANFADYLAGFDCQEESYIGNNQFISFGIIAVIVAIVFMLLYYYVINHPRFNRWWSWLIMLILTGTVNLFVGWKIVSSHLAAGNIGDCLLYNADKTMTLIGQMNCWGFGLANFIVSVLWFILFSFCFKWGSRNCKYSPF